MVQVLSPESPFPQRPEAVPHAKAVGFTILYTAVATLVILKAIQWTIGLRVSEEAESEGLDIALHNERGYNL